MNANHFDNLTRLFATTSRRQILKMAIGTAIGGWFGFRAGKGSTFQVHAATPSDKPCDCYLGGTCPQPSVPWSCAIQTFPSQGTHFKGAPVLADVQFFPALHQLDACAAANNVDMVVTNSFRTCQQQQQISAEVEFSDHLAGHAIDVTFTYFDDQNQPQTCGWDPSPHIAATDSHSPCLAKGKVLPPSIQAVLDCVNSKGKSLGLRWGGDSTTIPYDPVHFDDSLYKRDNSRWKVRFDAAQTSVYPCPPGTSCSGGLCGCSIGQIACNGVCCDAGKTCCNGVCCDADQTCCNEVCCDAGHECCDGVCTNTGTNWAHCGFCSRQCGLGEVCIDGTCGERPQETACLGGQHPCLACHVVDFAMQCVTRCVDQSLRQQNCVFCGEHCGDLTCCHDGCFNLQTDYANCGHCGYTCIGGQFCAQGNCVCATGQTFCNQLCVDLLTDVENCGSCSTACTESEDCCHGLCTDYLIDDNNCGHCGHACIDGHCDKGKCICPTGKSLCPIGPNDQCFDLQISDQHCGQCAGPCPAGQHCCHGVCRDYQTDDQHCGACDNHVCPTGQHCCHGVCTDYQTNDNHCGCCGRSCSNGGHCQSGNCVCPSNLPNVCPADQTVCQDVIEQCVNFSNDKMNCNGCGVVCGDGMICLSSQCQCPTGMKDCGGRCIPVGTCCTNSDCGYKVCPSPGSTCQCSPGTKDCGSSCRACCTNSDCGYKLCQNGTCQCPSGTKDCGGRCGACCTNTDCSGNKTCQNGTCLCPPSQVCNGSCCHAGYGCYQGACSNKQHAVFSMFLYPNPPWEGLLPYIGTFGQFISNGTLDGLTNPTQNVFSIQVAGPTGGSVFLGPGASTTAQNIQQLYGAMHPSLPVQITAYIYNGASAPSSIWITVSYSY